MINPETIEQRIRETVARGLRPSRHLWEAEHIADRIRRRAPRHAWEIVSMVRDPIARAVSAFFHSIRLWWPELDLAGSGAMEAVRSGAMVDQFVARYPHERGLDWFDAELREPLGVDVYDHPFETAAGWGIVEAPRARVLIIRLEDLDRCAPTALGRFLARDPLPIPGRVNVAEDKRYAEAYRAFTATARLPTDYVERMYQSRLAKRFYAPAELAAFQERWTRGRA
jgi:hypothetical protein